MNASALVVAGILTFYLIDVVSRSLLGHDHSHGEEEHGQESVDEVLEGKQAKKGGAKGKGTMENSGGAKGKGKKNSKERKAQKAAKKSQTVAIMNMIGDMLHNFTDGVAIASSFMLDMRLGISTTLAVFFHEIPHEVGDFAVLIKSGYSLCGVVAF